MPYYRKYGRGRRQRRTRQPQRTLAPKNIRRRTGARAQSKQIASLNRKVSMLTKTNYFTFSTQWERLSLPIEALATTGVPYVLPIPANVMDGRQNAGVPTNVSRWRDSLAIASQPYYEKSFIFNYPDVLATVPEVYHKSTIIKYQVTCNEAELTKVFLAVVSPKKGIASQLIADNALDGTSVPFGPTDGNTNFVNGMDYVQQSGGSASGGATTVFGTLLNLQRWDVHYKREMAFGLPNAGTAATTAENVVPGTTGNNTRVASGTIRLPGIGRIRSISRGAPQVSNAANAITLGLLDQPDHTKRYVVMLSNGVTADGEGVYMGCSVVDTYRCPC